MMERNGEVLRSVAWAELFPWLNIFKTFRLAIGFRALAMSALAALLTVTGWGMFGNLFSTEAPSTAWLKPYAQCPWKELTGTVPDKPDFWGDSAPVEKKSVNPKDLARRAASNMEKNASVLETNTDDLMAKMEVHRKSSAFREPVSGSWSFLGRPMWEGFGLEVTFGNTICLICCGAWSLAIWAFFGAAITRIAVVQLAANERITLGASLRYACSKFFAYFFAPLFPLGGIALAVLPVLLFGLLLRFDVSTFLVALIWPILLISGLVIALLLLGLIFGWPLMWTTISTEGTDSDSFDALSRSYAYVFQRPLHYLFYFFVASVLGLLGWIFVKNFAAAVIWTTYWAASWGAGGNRVAELIAGGGAGASVIHFWTGCVKLLAVGFGFSFFWNAYAAIYLLLRRNVDATEMDEVSLDADEGEAKFGLPNIVNDETGAPVVEEKPPVVTGKSPEVDEKPPETAPPAESGEDAERQNPE